MQISSLFSMKPSAAHEELENTESLDEEIDSMIEPLPQEPASSIGAPLGAHRTLAKVNKQIPKSSFVCQEVSFVARTSYMPSY